jgi:hypothetical protein
MVYLHAAGPEAQVAQVPKDSRDSWETLLAVVWIHRDNRKRADSARKRSQKTKETGAEEQTKGLDDLEIIALLNDFVHRFLGRLQAGQARRQSEVVSDNARTECAIAQNKIEEMRPCVEGN